MTYRCDKEKNVSFFSFQEYKRTYLNIGDEEMYEGALYFFRIYTPYVLRI